MLFTLLTASLAISSAVGAANNCRCFPSEACWPAPETWSKFNESIDGRLIATVPLAAPCHAPNYDADECNALRKGWIWPEEQYVLAIP